MSALYSCLKGKNDSIMAATSSDRPQASETDEAHDENAGKKKSKFQAFKNFFVKKKRKECPTPTREPNLKPSQSSSDVSASAGIATNLQAASEPGSKGNMGNKALSHNSVFLAESENIKERSSQENIPGKVKSLQLSFEQNLRIGSSPRGIIPKNVEDSGALSEDDGLPRSPPEISSLHDLFGESANKLSTCVQRRSSLGLGGTDSEDEQGSSRPLSPFSCPTSPASRLILVDFTIPASSRICLDNSAAKHKIAVKPKRQRVPAVRLNQNVSDQPKESGVTCTANAVAKPEPDSQNAKSTEDLAITLPVEDVIPLPEVEDGPELGEEVVLLVPLVLELKDDETVDDELSQEEDGKSEADVDLHSSPEPEGDRIDTPIEVIERDADAPLSDTVFPKLQEDVVMDMAELPVSINAVKVVCDVNAECDPTDCSENMSVTETIESTSYVFEGEDQSQREQSVPSLSEPTEIVERMLVVEEVPLPELEHSSVSYSTAKPTEEDEDASGTPADCEGIESQETVEGAETTVCDDHGNSYLNSESLDTHASADPGSKSESDQLNHGIDCHEASDTQVLSVCVTENHNHESCSITVSNGVAGNPLDALPCVSPLLSISDECKPAETNIDGKPKSTAKPVKFTVATAWQRSFSSRNVLKSGLFHEEEAAVTLNKDDSRKTENVTENVPFGIRLRSTSTPLKYSEDSLKLLPVDIESMDLSQNSPTLTPTSQTHVDGTKESKASENITPLKTNVDDPLLRLSAAPEWISMAKQKRKVFQVHPLAREPGIPAAKDKSPAQSYKKMDTDSSPHILEAKQKMEPVSLDVPAAPREIQSVTEKSTGQAPSENPDEPPWMSLAKKKAKAWSEMPNIAQ